MGIIPLVWTEPGAIYNGKCNSGILTPRLFKERRETLQLITLPRWKEAARLWSRRRPCKSTLQSLAATWKQRGPAPVFSASCREYWCPGSWTGWKSPRPSPARKLLTNLLLPYQLSAIEKFFKWHIEDLTSPLLGGFKPSIPPVSTHQTRAAQDVLSLWLLLYDGYQSNNKCADKWIWPHFAAVTRGGRGWWKQPALCLDGES